MEKPRLDQYKEIGHCQKCWKEMKIRMVTHKHCVKCSNEIQRERWRQKRVKKST